MKSTKTKSRAPKLNVRLLRRIKRHILSKPGRFFMRYYKEEQAPNTIIEGDYGSFNQRVPECGTVACIAGWACILSNKSGSRLNGSALLGTTERQTQMLFYDDSWPEPFAARYYKAKRPSARAKIAAARIEHLITTGE